MSAFDRQEGGNHYKDLPIQPVDYITANKIPFIEGNVIKYVTRWRNKGGVADLKKARHFLDMLIEKEECFRRTDTGVCLRCEIEHLTEEAPHDNNP